jgi:hypothetical protein
LPGFIAASKISSPSHRVTRPRTLASPPSQTIGVSTKVVTSWRIASRARRARCASSSSGKHRATLVIAVLRREFGSSHSAQPISAPSPCRTDNGRAAMNRNRKRMVHAF